MSPIIMGGLSPCQCEWCSAYHAYITGSDQDWNPNFKETSDDAYLLEFVPEG